MTKVIILSEDTLDRYYERRLQHLHDKYHVCPTNLAGGLLSEEDAAQLSYYEGMARELAGKISKPRYYFRGPKRENLSRDTRYWGCKPLGKIVF